MVDEFREVTTSSFGEQIAGSFMGVVLGIILFIASFPLIWWNEGRSVDRIKTLDEARNLVIAVSSEEVDRDNNKELIHISGKATTNDILKDKLFGVEENALKLNRIVEMYQWSESSETTTKQNLGGSETTETTYSYKKIWSEQLIDSSNFKKVKGHKNPSSMQYTTKTFTADNVKVGAFKLNSVFTKQIGDFVSYDLSEENLKAMNRNLQKYFKLNGNEYFYGDPSNPQIGSVKIKYTIVNPSEVSVIGKQKNNKIKTYNTQNGEINLLEMGDVGANAMLSIAETENSVTTWITRFLAFLVMWIGLAMVFRPIQTLTSVIPFMGTIIGAGVGMITGLASIVLSLITMALAWLFFRPLIGVALLIIAGGILFTGFKFLKKKASKLENNNSSVNDKLNNKLITKF